MKVILFTIGDFPIRSYGIIVMLAVFLSMGVAHYLTRNTIYQKHIMNMMFFVIIGALIGARIWHVFFFQWGYYSQNISQIFAIWNGGIAIQGALMGGLATVFIYTRVYKISFFEFADYLAPAVIFGQAIGRIACFLNGDAYGSPTNAGFGIVYPPGTMAFDQYGSQPLWPAEIWEGQWDLVVFAILIMIRNKTLPVGYHFVTYSIMYAIGRFFLEFLRGDSPRYSFNWTAGQWTSAFVVLGSAAALLYLFNKARKKGK
ncbi:prolipoprotein diacylglyceryl transferase [Paenibacillus sp. FSL A5-0031]|uniref:prolipoprotein diacylglyceryl transferase n=1 Tax=Paenibacillus sp. FSL A5-0031 TaxID=1920420 RepID=UPI00096F3D0C|nr:prolipoprotein diacylglyceryl transferase [Paenibacillus sp. FSL A5-0031]OME78706.1 prolipoprotein diacylglyceryl transferase [Paenibacillus sp. FSL A5-0031]